MISPTKEAYLELRDDKNYHHAELIIKPSGPHQSETLYVASQNESLDLDEESIQLIEECRYEYELISEEELRLQVVPNIITRSVLSGRVNTGTIEPGAYVGILPIVAENESGEIVAGASVEVRSSKIGYRHHYRRMLSFIADKCTELLLQIRSPVLGRFRPSLTEPSRTIAQRFSFIRSLLTTSEFRSAVYRVISDPHVRSTIEEYEHEIERGFRPNCKTIRQLASGFPRKNIYVGLELSTKLPSVPRRINEIRNVETVDTPENRFVKYALESFDLFLADMAKILECRRRSFSDERLLKEIVSLRRELSIFLSHNIFRKISPPNIMPLGSPVLQRREGYREIFLSWLKFDAAARLVWSGGNDVYEGGKRDIATLYEYWIFFKLLDVVSVSFELNIPKVEDLIEETSDGFGLKLKAGHRLLIEDISYNKNRPLKVRFAYNRTFSRTGKNSTEVSYPNPGSWTRRMRPDYTLSLWPAELIEKEAEELELIWHVHFDAKYKISQPGNSFTGIGNLFGPDTDENLELSKHAQKRGRFAKSSDLLTMHGYRDAIRRTEGAYIIYPGDESRKWRAYYEILPGIGAFAVNPGAEDVGLRTLEQFIRDIAHHVRNRASLRERERYHKQSIHCGKRTFNVFESLPELEVDGKRFVPPDEHLILIWPSSGQDFENWILETGSFCFLLPKGRFRSNLIGIKHIVLYRDDMLAFGPLRVLSPEVEILLGNELQRQGFPGKVADNSVFMRFRIERETRFSMKNVDLEKIISSTKTPIIVEKLSTLFCKGDIDNSMEYKTPSLSTMLYFAYGSNMSDFRLKNRVPSANLITTGSISGHVIKFNKVSKKDGSGKGHIVQTGNQDDLVYGVVYEFDEAEKDVLNRAEGLGFGYDEKTVTVSTPHGEIEAITYYGTNLDDSLKPYAWYMGYVISGAKENNLPETYIAKLKQVDTIEDQDPDSHDI